ncbi:MAG TPA: BNR repeat-containing protein [Paludibacteraceae bacterium]|nr:BNR repeat-containing protein [Paludibacteraceae bacterium]HPT43154.1 BNR repeat-containing protein [Paludibacteraceae bacterium]
MSGRKLLFLFLIITVTAGKAQKLMDTGGMAYSRNSVNTTVFRSNSVVSSGKYQYIAFYDQDGFIVLGQRKITEKKWKFEKTRFTGNCADAHNVISIMADDDGYLHMSFDQHDRPLNYCRSLQPNSLKMGDKEQMTGNDENKVTYPEFYRLRNKNLLFVYRSGASGRGNMVMKTYNLKTKTWENMHSILIDGQNRRNAYWQLFVDHAGTIHLSWVWRESPGVETNHDLCYARSLDNGKTWEKSNGEKYTLPITAESAEYAWKIPQKSELINQTSMTADSNGNPYIATYWRDSTTQVPQFRVVWFDGNKWKQQQVTNRSTPFSLSGGGTKMIPVSRPRIVIDKKNQIKIIYRDAERDSKVTLASCSDINQGIWNFKDMTGFQVGAWEPTYDTELWRTKNRLQVFVINTAQGDGEKLTDLTAQPVYILNIK